MRHFVEIQTSFGLVNIITKAKNFAKQVTPTVGSLGYGYRDTNQINLRKIEKDHFVSKVGEEAVKIMFEKLGRKVRGPDYQIYEAKQKSWDSDLYIGGLALAVKTQSTTLAKKFGLSWTFQAGSSRKDPILNNLNAWVCFVEFNEMTCLCHMYPPYQIEELTFSEPKLEKQIGSKKVVYAESLPAL